MSLIRLLLCEDYIATLSHGRFANARYTVVMVGHCYLAIKLGWEGPFKDGNDTDDDGN